MNAATARPASPARDQQLAAARDWLWAHTAQPNGDPWNAAPEHLASAAGRLVQHLGGAR